MKMFLENLVRSMLNAVGYRSEAQIQSALAKIFEATGTDPNEFATSAVRHAKKLDDAGNTALEKAEKDKAKLVSYYNTRSTTIKGQEDAGKEKLREAARVNSALAGLGISILHQSDESLLD